MIDQEITWNLNPELQDLVDSGDGAAVADVLRGFLDDTEDQLRKAEAAIRAEDYAALTFVAHSLSGSAATVGLEKFSAVARELQLLAQAHQRSESQKHLDDLRSQVPATKVALGRAIRVLEIAS